MGGLIRVDPAAHRAWQGDRELNLPSLVFSLLAHLVAHAGQAVTHHQLLRDIWQISWTDRSKTLGMHVSLLRRAIGDDAENPTYITTLRGHGYRFNPDMVVATEQPAAHARIVHALTAAWPALADDPVYVDQLAETALSAIGEATL